MSYFVALDDRVLEHAREELSHANALGKELLGVIDSGRGRWYAVSPEHALEHIYEFRTAVYRERKDFPRIGVERVRSTERDVAAWVAAILRRHTDWALVSESYLLRASDLGAAFPLPGATYSDSSFVYHVATPADSTEVILDVIRTIYAVPLGVGVILSGRLPPAAPEGVAEIPQVSSLAPSAQIVLVGAYDGESVLVWIRQECRCELNLGPIDHKFLDLGS